MSAHCYLRSFNSPLCLYESLFLPLSQSRIMAVIIKVAVENINERSENTLGVNSGDSSLLRRLFSV